MNWLIVVLAALLVGCQLTGEPGELAATVATHVASATATISAKVAERAGSEAARVAEDIATQVAAGAQEVATSSGTWGKVGTGIGSVLLLLLTAWARQVASRNNQSDQRKAALERRVDTLEASKGA